VGLTLHEVSSALLTMFKICSHVSFFVLSLLFNSIFVVLRKIRCHCYFRLTNEVWRCSEICLELCCKIGADTCLETGNKFNTTLIHWVW
jgi:hypothetical protein